MAAPDGGAFVLLTPADRDLPSSLVTVTPGFALGGSVPLPRLGDAWAAHVLRNGAVAVTGRLADGYGVEVVDPATGEVRTTVVSPTGRRPDSEGGRSALSPDGATLYLVLSVVAGDDVREQLFAIDTSTGRVLAQRDLADDVAAASSFPIGRQLAGLVARPSGGATVVFDASPTDVAERRIPTLLTFDAGLAPVGGPVRATGLAEGAETKSVAGAADGTVFLLVTVEDGAWVLGVPDGGGAGPAARPVDRPHLRLRAGGRAGAGVGGDPRPDGSRGHRPHDRRGAGSADRRVRAAARRPQPVPRPGRRADDRRMRHPAGGHPDAVVPGPLSVARQGTARSLRLTAARYSR